MATLRLSERQYLILRFLARGWTQPQIADALGLRPSTVKNHIDGLYAKLGATSKTEAVVEGWRRGLLP